MRWFFTNPHPLREALAALGETIVGAAEHTQIGHPAMGWLRALVAETEATRPPAVEPISWALRQRPPTFTLGDPAAYPLGRIIRDLRPDIVVLTPMDQARSGFSLGDVNRWRNTLAASRYLVGIGQDPGAYRSMQSEQWRGCACKHVHLNIYVSDHAPTAKASAAGMRTAVYRNPEQGALALLAAVASCRRNYATSAKNMPFE